MCAHLISLCDLFPSPAESNCTYFKFFTSGENAVIFKKTTHKSKTSHLPQLHTVRLFTVVFRGFEMFQSIYFCCLPFCKTNHKPDLCAYLNVQAAAAGFSPVGSSSDRDLEIILIRQQSNMDVFTQIMAAANSGAIWKAMLASSLTHQFGPKSSVRWNRRPRSVIYTVILIAGYISDFN